MAAYAKGVDPKSAPKPDKTAVRQYNKEHPPTRNVSKDTTGSLLPVNGPVSSPFGHRTTVGAAHNHLGTDFAVPIGTKVLAPADGVITGAGKGSGGEGNYVILDADGEVHKFFHLSKILVHANDQVSAGDVIALSGNTGYSTGPHLHWEKRIAGTPVDPMRNVA
jgi:murein DD-endopeptidase MepM/ murein hydrolase activator NlpD